MTTSSIGLSDALAAYVRAQVTPADPLLAELATETAGRYPEWTSMQIAPEQGGFLGLLVRLTRARLAVEVGTFTGYSSICIARNLADGGHVICFDASPEWTEVARRYWDRAGVADRIDLRLGDAHDRIRELDDVDQPVDFAFIDADKEGYPVYYEAVLDRLAPDGLIAVDNTLAGGQVVDPPDDGGMAPDIARFNDVVRTDDRVTSVLVPIGDGLTLIRRR